MDASYMILGVLICFSPLFFIIYVVWKNRRETGLFYAVKTRQHVELLALAKVDMTGVSHLPFYLKIRWTKKKYDYAWYIINVVIPERLKREKAAS